MLPLQRLLSGILNRKYNTLVWWVMSYQKAIFAAGCFWGVEQKFSNIFGVVSTRVGYTGGTLDDPTYKKVCRTNTGHAEAVELTYDPDLVSYSHLVDVFFCLHSPFGSKGVSSYKSQYRSAAYYRDIEQKEVLETKIQALVDEEYPDGISTEIAPVAKFWQAEEYHQQYYKKKRY